eukprot:jgi/Bigna1/65172/fgenesh1_kg.99_\
MDTRTCACVDRHHHATRTQASRSACLAHTLQLCAPGTIESGSWCHGVWLRGSRQSNVLVYVFVSVENAHAECEQFWCSQLTAVQ